MKFIVLVTAALLTLPLPADSSTCDFLQRPSVYRSLLAKVRMAARPLIMKELGFSEQDIPDDKEREYIDIRSRELAEYAQIQFCLQKVNDCSDKTLKDLQRSHQSAKNDRVSHKVSNNPFSDAEGRNRLADEHLNIFKPAIDEAIQTYKHDVQIPTTEYRGKKVSRRGGEDRIPEPDVESGPLATLFACLKVLEAIYVTPTDAGFHSVPGIPFFGMEKLESSMSGGSSSRRIYYLFNERSVYGISESQLELCKAPIKGSGQLYGYYYPIQLIAADGSEYRFQFSRSPNSTVSFAQPPTQTTSKEIKFCKIWEMPSDKASGESVLHSLLGKEAKQEIIDRVSKMICRLGPDFLHRPYQTRGFRKGIYPLEENYKLALRTCQKVSIDGKVPKSIEDSIRYNNTYFEDISLDKTLLAKPIEKLEGTAN